MDYRTEQKRMKVKQVIDILSKLNDDEEIVIAWWEWSEEAFPSITQEQWNENIHNIEGWMEWSDVYEYIVSCFEMEDLLEKAKQSEVKE
tara:strand:+ start:198 stop:464 length:267 start_codon:yes stop_codon:yes gene_type:complete